MKSMRASSLVLAVSFVAASCSGGSDEPAATDAPSTSPATEPTEPAAPTTEPQLAPETTEDSPDSEPVATTEPAPETTAPDPEPDPEPELPDGYSGFVSEIYADQANWVCLPGKADDVCARDLDAKVVYADGSTELEPFVPAVAPVVDCFYVYPTVSNDPEASSDLIPAEAEEIYTTLNQAARLGEQCRVFAPIYRQLTLTALLGQVESDASSRTLAYDDVVDSFKHFIANLSEGRPFVLLGHSQGAGILRVLVDQEIDDEPLLRDRMLSAMLLGASVSPEAYDNIPPCASASDTSCVVSYSSYRDTVPPPDDGIFGRTASGPAMCVNPVDPAGGAAVSSPYFSMEGNGGVLSSGSQPFDDEARSAEITTPYVSYPDMITVECVDDGQFGYLQLTITTGDGPRIDNIGGDLTPDWGMHLVDVNVAMGDLADLVASQSAAVS
jgi:hypothetical protein